MTRFRILFFCSLFISFFNFAGAQTTDSTKIATDQPTVTPTETPVVPASEQPTLTTSETPAITPSETPVTPAATEQPTLTTVETPTVAPVETPVTPPATETTTLTTTETPTVAPVETPVAPPATETPTLTSTETPTVPVIVETPTIVTGADGATLTTTEQLTLAPVETPTIPVIVETPTVTTGTEGATLTTTELSTLTPVDTPTVPVITETPTLTPATDAATLTTTETASTITTTDQPTATPTETTTVPALTDQSWTIPDSTAAKTAAVRAALLESSQPLEIKGLKKANMFYENKSYAEAIPYYEKAMQVTNSNKSILSNLGDCYRLTNNTKGQLLCYGGLVNLGIADPIHEFYYGQALLENGDRDKAKLFFEKYKADSRGKELASSFAKMRMYTKNMDAYSISPAPFNSPEDDYCPVKFFDNIVFASTRTKTVWIKKQQGWTNGNFVQLYTTDNSASYEPKPFMSDLDSKYNDGPVCFTKDYNTVYFTRNNSGNHERAKDGTFKLKILEASLDQNGFSMVKLMPFNNNDYNFAHPSISPDGYSLYFSSDMEGGKGNMDIYRCQKDSSGVWGPPQNMGDAVNTPGADVFPFISGDNKLYFSSNGRDGMGGLDIYETKIVDGKATKVYNMGEPVNSKEDDFGLYLLEDNKTGYICSNRKAGGLDDDIYNFQILKEPKRGKEATIIVKDRENGTPLDSAKLVINGDTVYTNAKGEYTTSIEDDVLYKLEVYKYDYFKMEDTVSAKSSPDDFFSKELTVEKDPKLFLRALITDAKTKELLEGVSIKLTDIAANSEVDNYLTTSSGDYFKMLSDKKVGDKLTYLVRIEKPGYLQRTLIFSHTIDKAGEINMNQSLNLSLGRVEVGMDLAKMIEMKPIYFDFGKSNIRKDAAIELDKIVQVMNEYPNMFIELGSHTDCRSSAASNMKLSTARAKASAAYIVKKGINKMRITGKGYGETKLLNNCACEGKEKSDCPEEEHEKNRRTEFLIVRLK